MRSPRAHSCWPGQPRSPRAKVARGDGTSLGPVGVHWLEMGCCRRSRPPATERCSMRRSLIPLLVLAVTASGCGPSASELREKTLSMLNTEADQWDGGPRFTTTAADAYGRPLTCTVEKTTF